MNYQITSDNIDLSVSMQTLAKQKMHKIEERIKQVPENLKSARIVMNSLKDGQFEVKLLVTVKGKEYFCQQKGYTLENAMVEAVDLVERELQTDKIVAIEDDWKEAREAKRLDLDDTAKIEEELIP